MAALPWNPALCSFLLTFFDLVSWFFGFYGISTFVGYLTPNSVYICIPFTNEYLVGKIFYKQDFTCLHMINQF